jgi:hypothetical protein
MARMECGRDLFHKQIVKDHHSKTRAPYVQATRDGGAQIHCGSCKKMIPFGHHVAFHQCHNQSALLDVATLRREGLVIDNKCMVCNQFFGSASTATHKCKHPLWNAGIYDISALFSADQLDKMKETQTVLKQLREGGGIVVTFIFPAMAPPDKLIEGDRDMQKFMRFIGSKREVQGKCSAATASWQDYAVTGVEVGGGRNEGDRRTLRWPLVRFNTVLTESTTVPGQLGLFPIDSLLLEDDVDFATLANRALDANSCISVERTRHTVAYFTGLWALDEAASGGADSSDGDLRTVTSGKAAVHPQELACMACMANGAHHPACNLCIVDQNLPWLKAPIHALVLRARRPTQRSNAWTAAQLKELSAHGWAVDDKEHALMVLPPRDQPSPPELTWNYRAVADHHETAALDTECLCAWCTGVLQLPQFSADLAKVLDHVYPRTRKLFEVRTHPCQMSQEQLQKRQKA